MSKPLQRLELVSGDETEGIYICISTTMETQPSVMTKIINPVLTTASVLYSGHHAMICVDQYRLDWYLLLASRMTALIMH